MQNFTQKFLHPSSSRRCWRYAHGEQLFADLITPRQAMVAQQQQLLQELLGLFLILMLQQELLSTA